MKTMILKGLGFIAFIVFIFFITFLVPYGVGWLFFSKGSWGELYLTGLAAIIVGSFVLFVIGGVFYMAWKLYIDLFWNSARDDDGWPE